MNTPKISVVMPVYNVEKYLKQALDCVKNQTLEDIEIICVDDGSTDSSPAILDEYAAADSRFVIIHKENEGYGKAMNTGMDRARGKYFCTLDSDDCLLPDSYEILYKAAEKFDADMVRSDYFDMTTRNGKMHLDVRQISKDHSYYYRYICPNREPEVYSFYMHTWTGIYKRDFLESKHVRHSETPGASYQDNSFFFKVFSQTEKLVYIPRPCYCYRIDNPGSSIHDKSKVYTMSQEYKLIREFLAEHPEFEQDVLPAYYARLFRAHLQTYKRIDREFRREYAELMRKDMVAARDQHILDTGLFTESERVYLAHLLNSLEEFLLVTHDAGGSMGKKRVLFLYKRMIQEKGLKSFLREMKRRIKM